MAASESSRLSHESFVSGHNGSSLLDIIITLFPILPGSVIASSFTKGKEKDIWCFCIEFIFCVIPLILSFTLLNQIALEFNAILIFLLLIRMVICQDHNVHSKIRLQTIDQDGKLSCLTSSRATVNIATIIAILAVDFHIFSRRFAKTETYGYSLMDVGAACFLFMNGITDFNRKILTRKTLKDVFILLVLGVLRLLSLRTTNYQQHVTEYGVHGNFFFTLAAVKVLCVWASRLPPFGTLLSCLLLAVGHETALAKGLANWTLSDASRSVDLLNANREWVVSLPGNALIYLLGLAAGNVVFAQDRKDSKLLRLFLPVVPFVVLFFLDALDMEPSRRLANVAFVTWIAGFFFLFMTLFKIVESRFGRTSCHIFQAVNSHGLIFFLVGNLLTGFINLSVNTLEVNNLTAFVIIVVYSFSLCYFVFLLNTKEKSPKRK